MSLRILIPLVLWTAVLVVGVTIFLRSGSGDGSAVLPTELEPVASEPPVSNGPNTEPVLWDHLPDVDRFVLTDQQGQPFDSQQVGRRPMVVSFFFSTCPSFCRNLNNQLDRLNQATRDLDLQFVTITVDPENDTVDALSKYAAGYDATPDRWAFLTGEQGDLVDVGEHQFNVPIDPGTHTDNILLVDRWGRFRDRFKWDNAADMKRFLKVAKQVANETEPPLHQMLETRVLTAGIEPPQWNAIPWLNDFHLTDHSNASSFFSRDMTGQVWLTCFADSGGDPTAILGSWQQLNAELKAEPVALVVIGDAQDASRLQTWSSAVDAVPGDGAAAVRLVTGIPSRIKRIAEECYGVAWPLAPEQSNRVLVNGRWGDVGEAFDLSQPGERQSLIETIAELRRQEIPPFPSFGFGHPGQSDE